MRQNIVAGNWKMNKTLQEGVELAKELKEALQAQKPNCRVIIGTPFIHLTEVCKIVDQDLIGVSAQIVPIMSQGPTPVKYRLKWLNQPVPLTLFLVIVNVEHTTMKIMPF